MSIEKSKAIVIRSQKLGETSKIITLYSRDFGKIKVVAKGSRGPKSRFMGSLDNLNLIDFVFYHKVNRELHTISQADIIESFKNIRNNLDNFALASLANEIVVKSQELEEKNYKLFELLSNFLYEINRKLEQPELFFFWFQLNFLIISGFEPHLNECLVCAKKYSSIPISYFSYSRGGIYCETCASDESSYVEMSRETMSLLNRLNLRTLNELKEPVARHTIREISRALYLFMTYHVTGVDRLKSLEFLKKVWNLS